MSDTPAHSTVFRDYLLPTHDTEVTALVDFVGEVESDSIGYRIGNRLVRANNDLISSITGIPGQMRDNWRILANSEQRKRLARGLVDDRKLNSRHRRALVSMFLWSLIIVYLVAALVLGIVNREALGTYQSVWGLFFLSLATSIFLPTPFELLLGNAVENLGVLWTVLVASTAKTVGAYLVLIMGDKARAGLEVLMERRPTIRRGFQFLTRLAQRFGLYFVFVMFAIPFNSDTAPLFVAALLGFRKSSFLAVMFVAIVLRSLLFIYAGNIFASVF